MAKLYGLHRSTLHEAVAKGRVSAGHDGKAQRVIDLSEMIRVYGEPPGRPTLLPDTPTPLTDSRPTPDQTPADTPAGWAEMVIELRLLREEVAGLRQELRLIEHKPDAPATIQAAPQPDPPAVATPAPVAAGSQQPSHAPAVAEVRTFADVLSSWV
jgi:hypothetical protein